MRSGRDPAGEESGSESTKRLEPERIAFAEPLQKVWIALRGSMRTVLEAVTLADVAADDLPAVVHEMLERPEAWEPH